MIIVKNVQSYSLFGYNRLNDITAVGEREFYFTNSGGYRMDTMMSKVEGYLGLR